MSQIQVEKITGQKRKELGVPDTPQEIGPWAVWTCDVSEFDWLYQREEVAYLHRGKVQIETDEKEYMVQEGDLAVFPKGLKCYWRVLEPVQKVYQFR